MQVESCVHISGSHWGAACSSLTGTSWHGGLSIFRTGDPFVTTHQWLCEEGGVTSLDVLSTDDAKTLVTGSFSGQVHVHSLKDDLSGKCVNTIEAHQGAVTAVSFNTKGTMYVIEFSVTHS